MFTNILPVFTIGLRVDAYSIFAPFIQVFLSPDNRERGRGEGVVVEEAAHLVQEQTGEVGRGGDQGGRVREQGAGARGWGREVLDGRVSGAPQHGGRDDQTRGEEVSAAPTMHRISGKIEKIVSKNSFDCLL